MSGTITISLIPKQKNNMNQGKLKKKKKTAPKLRMSEHWKLIHKFSSWNYHVVWYLLR